MNLRSLLCFFFFELQFQEETLEYEEIAKRAEKNPRKQLILCLAAENKQLEQLKMQNRTLETSLEEHELTLEMIMSKYREQVCTLPLHLSGLN